MKDVLEKFYAEIVDKIVFEDCDRFTIYFKSGRKLYIRAYAQFDGCGDYDDTYLEINATDSNGVPFVDLDTQTNDWKK